MFEKPHEDAPFADSSYVESKIDRKIDSERTLSFIRDVMALWRYLRDNPTAAHVAMILFALGYFISPIDTVPDVIPVAGYLDDAGVIAAAVGAMGSALARYRH